MSKFNEGTEKTYEELPVPVNYIYWKRGNGQLEHLKASDPGAYFGGWSAMVDGSEEKLPELALPIVTRKSDDGKTSYQRYASNVISFLPISSRMRYELRIKSLNQKTGRDEEKITSVSREYISGVTVGYQPMKQIFGLVFSDDGNVYSPAVLKLNKWSSFLSFNKAAQVWSKVKVSDDKVLIRRYGTIGATDKGGSVFPNFETFNEGKSTPIEAINTSSPLILPLTPELDKLWDDAQAWSKCERWNVAGKVETTESVLPPMPEVSDEFPFGEPIND